MSFNLDGTIWHAKGAINDVATSAAKFGDFDRARMDLILDKVNEANAAMSALLSTEREAFHA